MAAPSKVKITAKDFAAKYKSKREVYNFLSVDCSIYLPKIGKYLLNLIDSLSISKYRISQHLLLKGHCKRKEEE